jgi:Zn-dependent M16 (insulinase) family peptidase
MTQPLGGKSMQAMHQDADHPMHNMRVHVIFEELTIANSTALLWIFLLDRYFIGEKNESCGDIIPDPVMCGGVSQSVSDKLRGRREGLRGNWQTESDAATS